MPVEPHRGEWADDEHERFLKAIELYNKDWNLITEYVATRTKQQVQSHAQKYNKHLDDLRRKDELYHYSIDNNNDGNKQNKRHRTPVDYNALSGAQKRSRTQQKSNASTTHKEHSITKKEASVSSPSIAILPSSLSSTSESPLPYEPNSTTCKTDSSFSSPLSEFSSAPITEREAANILVSLKHYSIASQSNPLISSSLSYQNIQRIPYVSRVIPYQYMCANTYVPFSSVGTSIYTYPSLVVNSNGKGY